MAPVRVDGSQGEGGGQIVRTSAALAARTHTPVRVENVRAKRDNPGLRPQHVAALNAVGKACRGRFEGLSVGSDAFTFYPGRVEGGMVRVATGTAASAVLIVEAGVALAPSLPTPLTIEARGGTDVRWAPTLEHMRSVLIPLSAKAGVDVDVLASRAGFYPKGGGRVRALVSPVEEPCWGGMMEERGRLEHLEVTVRVNDLPEHIPERIVGSFQEHVAQAGFEASSYVEEVEAASPGVVVDAVAVFEDTVLGANHVGEKGVPSERVGQECATRLLAELEGPGTVDVHAADRLVPLLMGRVDGGFVVREVTGHLATNVRLCERFLGGRARFEEGERGGTRVVFEREEG